LTESGNADVVVLIMRTLPRHAACSGFVLGAQSETDGPPPATMLVGPSGVASVRDALPFTCTGGVKTDEPPAHPATIVDASNAAIALGRNLIGSSILHHTLGPCGTRKSLDS
jgi:hypothetical protein